MSVITGKVIKKYEQKLNGPDVQNRKLETVLRTAGIQRGLLALKMAEHFHGKECDEDIETLLTTVEQSLEIKLAEYSK